MLNPKHHRNRSRWCFSSPPQRLRGACRGRCRAQLFATKERYRCGLPLAGTHRPDSAILHRTIVYGCRGGHCPPDFSLRPFFSFSFEKEKNRRVRQKKPAALRFRRGGESSISAGSFFLSESRPLRWVAFRLLLEKKRTFETGSANRAAIASEEASSIPFPPGRRKLHIRSLLLPSQIVTVSLGHNLAIWNFTTPHAILMMAGRRLLTNIATSELRCMK